MFRAPRRSGARVVVPVCTALLVAVAPLRADEAAAPVAGGELYAATGDVIRMEAYRVSADLAAESRLGLLLARQDAGMVSDAIGSDEFSQLAVGDAAEAMTKVTGASLVDDKYVLIRGLGDRYANTLMNGTAVPTADPDKRAVQMDQFPADLLESIVTTKSFTPDQPGAFSGGSVNLRTKNFPEQFFVSASAGLEVNSEATGEHLLRAPGLSRAPTLPAVLPSRTAAELASRQGNFALAEELDAATRAFGDDRLFPRTRRADPGSRLSAAVGNRHFFGESGVFGYTASATFSRDFSHETGGEANRFNGTSESVQPRLLLTADRRLLSFDPASAPASTPDFGVTASTFSENLGLFASLTVRPVESHEIGLDLFYNDVVDETVRRGVGEEANNYAGNIFEVYDLLTTERQVASAQLNGHSTFAAADGLKVEWRASYSRSTQDQPDYRTLSTVYDLAGRFVNATGVQPNRFFRDLTEDATEAGVDATYPFTAFNGREHQLKVGGVFSRNEREYDEQRFQYQGNPADRAQLETYPNPIGIVDRTANSVAFGRVITRLQEPNNYVGEQEISAGYVMADARLSERWRAIVGVRYEQTEIETVPVRTMGLAPRNGRIDDGEALPALSLVYAINPEMNWRVAYGRTLARPTFKELTDIRYEDVFTSDVYIGNPDLELSIIDNFDLRWEWFPRQGETIAISAFHKRIDRPIEVLFQPGVGSIQPQNVGEGTVSGLEFEFRRELGAFGEAFRAFSLGANLTLVDSAVKIPAAELALLRSVDPGADDERKLHGQSPYVANLDLTWTSPSRATVATLSWNLVGERLDLVNYGPLPDVFEQPAPLLNLVVSQRLGERWRLKLAAKNLLDPDHETTIDTAAGELAWARSRSGRTFAVSLSYFFE